MKGDLAAVLCLGPADGWQMEAPPNCNRITATKNGRTAIYKRGPGRAFMYSPAESDDMPPAGERERFELRAHQGVE